jgi:hypothetical protein
MADTFNWHSEFNSPEGEIFTKDYLPEPWDKHPDSKFLYRTLHPLKDIYLYPHTYVTNADREIFSDFSRGLTTYSPIPNYDPKIDRIGLHLPLKDINNFKDNERTLRNLVRRHAISRLVSFFPDYFPAKTLEDLGHHYLGFYPMYPQYAVREYIHSVLDNRLKQHNRYPQLDNMSFHHYVGSKNKELSDFIKQLTSMDIKLSHRMKVEFMSLEFVPGEARGRKGMDINV